jgi:O-antigen ligase
MDLRKSGQTNIGIVVLLFFLAIAIPLLTFFGYRLELSVIIILAAAVFLVSFLNTDFALIILIFSMLLSPEIRTGDIYGRAVKIRADDIFIIVIFLGWIARMAINKELGFFRVTPLNRPLQVYILISLIATFYGALRGFVQPKEGAFYFLKYFEYYLLFFLVTNNLKTRPQAKRFIYCIIFVALIISIYAWQQHLSGVERVSAPFEIVRGESNTLGGYLILIISLALGLILNLQWDRKKAYLLVVLGLAFTALLFTLSRGSWLAFFASCAALFFSTRSGKKAMIVGAIILVMLSPTIMPKYVEKRFKTTFVGPKQYKILGVAFRVDESTQARIDSWQIGLARWIESPIIGKGISSAGPATDNQYTRVMIETGALGLICFIWILVELMKNAVFVLKQFWNDRFAVGIAAGFIAGLAGLIIHSFSAATFIIIRIMEPFWFLAAIVVMLPEMVPEPGATQYEE